MWLPDCVVCLLRCVQLTVLVARYIFILLPARINHFNTTMAALLVLEHFLCQVDVVISHSQAIYCTFCYAAPILVRLQQM